MRTNAERKHTFDFISRCAAENVTSNTAIKAVLYLYDCPKDGKEDSPTKLAKVCGVSTAAISGVLDILEGRPNTTRRGNDLLISRSTDDDRRRQHLRLTPLGECLIVPTA